MKPWFRHYVGMTRDDRLIEAAMRSKQPLDRVVFIWCCILESASECDEGGAFLVAPETIAYQLRVPVARIRAVFDALAEGGRIAEGRVAQWSSRQFESDTSASRMRRHRAAKRGHSDADVTHGDVTVTDQSRAEQSRTEPSKLGRAGEPATDAGPGRADDLRSLEARCLGLFPVGESPRGSFAPVALLVQRGADPEDLVVALRAEVAKPRRTPIASWPGWAKPLADRLAAAPKVAPPSAPVGPADDGPKVETPFAGRRSVAFLKAEHAAGRWSPGYGPPLGDPRCVIAAYYLPETSPASALEPAE